MRKQDWNKCVIRFWNNRDTAYQYNLVPEPKLEPKPELESEPEPELDQNDDEEEDEDEEDVKGGVDCGSDYSDKPMKSAQEKFIFHQWELKCKGKHTEGR